MKNSVPHHIIAIGASAGGLEELNTFFDHTPLDGIAYVIVQHLSPDFKSHIVELLSKHSKLLVKEAENKMLVKTNVVYLIPNNKYLTIKSGYLFLTAKDKGKGPNLTVNTFFNSLAADCGKKAIGVILSGLGSDGTEGILAIKDAGGMAIARNPETSSFSSMPFNAITTGVIDYVLEPQDMPQAIEDYILKQTELLAENEDDEKNVTVILAYIKEHSPLDFADYKLPTILRRIKRRASFNNCSNLTKYLEFLKITPEEVEDLTKEFLISVTSFFRDKEAFASLQKNIIPKILESLNPDDELKFWVTGCATGEEAYSIAILIAEQLTGKFKNTIVKIFATDIDTAALLHAGKGIYKSNIKKAVSAQRLQNYFINDGDNYIVKPEIRKMVIFALHDLVKNPPYCNMHFISCRNLLIYMTPTLQKKVFLLLLFGLKMEGYLFLGTSENPLPIIQNLKVVDKKWKIFKNFESKRLVRFDAFSLPVLIDKKNHHLPLLREDASTNMQANLADAINETLLSNLNILVICIDENNNVIKYYGDATKFLLQKNFKSNLTDLLPRPLAIAFNALSNKTLKTNKNYTTKGIIVKQKLKKIKINLSVSPLIVKNSNEKLLLVTLSESKAPKQNSAENTTYDEKIYLDQYTLNIEEENKNLKEKLNSTYLQLDASNENMQSFNEELLSANEEMQSTNEEMQSVNEELHTINADHQLKNKELLDLNDDLNNYFRSNINGQLFVNNDLLLMKYSPGTVKQINLLPSDIGRPLSNISTNIKFETILEDIKNVIKNGGVVTKEIETDNGKWYQSMTMPYIQQSTKLPTGAIITFNDITQIKKTQIDLDKKNERLLRINADLDNFVNVTSHDLLGPLGNIELSIGVMNRVNNVDPKLNKYLDIINESVKKFRSLITDIATIAKVENDIASNQTVNLNELIDNVEWSLNDKINASKATIVREFEVEEIKFSRKNMRSILYNLISNGIKFRGTETPIVKIKTYKDNGNIVLTIQDNGKGIPKKELNKIFKMYGRLDDKIEGHGVGLCLIKKIIESAKGSILVESEPDKGTTFTIQIKQE